MANFFSLFFTGKSLSEALNFASTNPQYDNRLFIVHENCQNTCRTCFVHKLLFLFRFDIQNNFGTQHVLQMLWASVKDLPVLFRFSRHLHFVLWLARCSFGSIFKYKNWVFVHILFSAKSKQTRNFRWSFLPNLNEQKMELKSMPLV